MEQVVAWSLGGCGGLEGRWRSQRVKLEQVGKSAGMHVPQLVPNCKCVKSKGVGQICMSVCGCALLHGIRGSGLKRHSCFNPAKLNVFP